MKKLFITALLVAGSSAAVFGQGQVFFAGVNTSADLSANSFPTFNSPIYIDTVGGAKITGAAGRAEMLGLNAATAVAATTAVKGNLVDLYNPATTTVTWVNFGTRTSGAPTQGQGIPATSAGPGRVLNDVAYGGTALIQVAAWYGSTAAQYTTWAQAFNAAYGIGVTQDTALKIGVSAPMSVKVSTSLSDPNVPYVPYASFAVVSVPEPTTAAIAGLGLASMLILRRRKA